MQKQRLLHSITYFTKHYCTVKFVLTNGVRGGFANPPRASRGRSFWIGKSRTNLLVMIYLTVYYTFQGVIQ